MPASVREATAEVCWTTFRALSRKDRQAVFARFGPEREFRDDQRARVIVYSVGHLREVYR